MAQPAVELTQALVRFRTVNPPGNELACAQYLGVLLEGAGFTVAYHPFREDRANLVARIGGSETKPPLCFTGHLDTVPLGLRPWVGHKGALWLRGTTAGVTAHGSMPDKGVNRRVEVAGNRHLRREPTEPR